ncbi:hypothetical protein V6N13_011968 [Hibiscus sabdariffa]
MIQPSGNSAPNIVVNQYFSNGMRYWHPNCYNGFVVSTSSVGLSPRISSGVTYSVSGCVAVSGPLSGCTGVMATLRLEFHGSAPSYLFIGKTSVSKGKWEMVVGSFSLSTVPKRVIFYLEGPPPGDELIINSVVISCFNSSKSEIFPQTRKVFATATERTQSWNGIQQEITGRVQGNVAYNSAGNRQGLGAIAGKVHAKWFPIKSSPLFRRPTSRVQALTFLSVLSAKHAEKIPLSPPPVIESTVQQWIQALNNKDLMTAVQNRLTDLFSHVKEKFRH